VVPGTSAVSRDLRSSCLAQNGQPHQCPGHPFIHSPPKPSTSPLSGVEYTFPTSREELTRFPPPTSEDVFSLSTRLCEFLYTLHWRFNENLSSFSRSKTPDGGFRVDCHPDVFNQAIKPHLSSEKDAQVSSITALDFAVPPAGVTSRSRVCFASVGLV
jgi:hypothetical protein